MRKLLTLMLISAPALAQGEWTMYRSDESDPAARHYVSEFRSDKPSPGRTLAETNRLTCQSVAAALEAAADKDPRCAVDPRRGLRYWCEPGQQREAWR